MKQVAIIGTQGVPARYGGFESLVENIIGENCPADIHYTVFCSSKDLSSRDSSYKGCSLKYIPCTPMEVKASHTTSFHYVKRFAVMM